MNPDSKQCFVRQSPFSRVEPKGKRNYESLLQFIYDFRVRTEMSVANLAYMRFLGTSAKEKYGTHEPISKRKGLSPSYSWL